MRHCPTVSSLTETLPLHPHCPPPLPLWRCSRSLTDFPIPPAPSPERWSSLSELPGAVCVGSPSCSGLGWVPLGSRGAEPTVCPFPRRGHLSGPAESAAPPSGCCSPPLLLGSEHPSPTWPGKQHKYYNQPLEKQYKLWISYNSILHTTCRCFSSSCLYMLRTRSLSSCKEPMAFMNESRRVFLLLLSSSTFRSFSSRSRTSSLLCSSSFSASCARLSASFRASSAAWEIKTHEMVRHF